ncbi:hypothetical protein [Pseudonocardia kunmingensis]|uniref:hypothetical protein n=1 Tax=Pseudonocardia kunmingensis TaxID=630975 RepID=UPI00114DF98C|nr:hypothetical protein [Pseudonocardia kunmingensis]
MTVAVLRAAVADPVVVGRYFRLVQRGRPEQCWPWVGAISGRGHGRFHLAGTYVVDAEGQRLRRTHVVIAHRFGYAVRYGVDALLRVPVVAHGCDNPLCQNPRCWRESDPVRNRREYLARRGTVLGALADTRGARGRARAVRDAVRAGDDVAAAVLAGASAVHRDQLAMFDEPSRANDAEYGPRGMWVESGAAANTENDPGHVPADDPPGGSRLSLFDPVTLD